MIDIYIYIEIDVCHHTWSINSQTRSMEQAAHGGQQAKGQRKKIARKMLTKNSERGDRSRIRNHNARQGD